ncbi:hypothetical protein CIW52_01950 [Mycolicibacterium sp. P9-64]|uniref:DUF3987 domain-containing protein n=1 Tax=Mycolicibacterium sp. P9-64 TaxID=2024612 RepID=UPI0011EF2CF7|nr:DUF3987 domain-containing protein [Mycolicibacterium sp. P9-64]KAA0086699.1 hypothetical protein CIW52_01950 [Mycolicibacterium sp. P9-64]
MIDATSVEPMRDIDPNAEFWSQREELDHILRFARYRRAAPWAVLISVLRRTVACIEPNVVLPPTVGSFASMNLFTASVGRSGQGKGASEAAGFDAVRFINSERTEIDTSRPNPGSGEGLARLFKGRGDEERPVTRAHLIVPEVSTLAALAGRQGATLTSELLKAFSGEPLGFTNAHKDTTTAVPAHSYRLCLGVGVQPENADFFLSRTKDGFPQRFVWVPTDDPHAPDVPPRSVEPIDVKVPSFGAEPFAAVSIPDRVAKEIDYHRLQVLRGASEVDPLDGHLMLTRLKVAFALAVLAGRKDIDVDDWKLGGEIIDLSTHVRGEVQSAVDQRHRRDNESKAVDSADRDAIVAARLSEKTQRRVAEAIVRKLERVDSATRHELFQNCASNIRSDFDPVFEMFIDKQFIVISEDSRDGQVEQFRLAR